MATQKDVARALLDRHPRSFGEELGIKVSQDSPSQLFRLLVASLLFSARISSEIATEAAKALFDAGWTTPKKMCDAGWDRRTRVLNRAGYARYDERTSKMLGDTSALLLDRWKGDLRRLRDEAERAPDRERSLLQEFKGIGEVGADIFFREVQVAWDEVYPFADRKALQAAGKVDLPKDPRRLAKLVSREELPRLLDALLRDAGRKESREAVHRQAEAR